MAAILDTVLNFSKSLRVTKVRPVDSENGPPRLPKTITKKTISDISRFTQNIPLIYRTICSSFCI